MQWKSGSAYGRWLAVGMACAVSIVLVGCGVSGSMPPTNYDNPVVLQGQVFAARNYMPGATVKVYITQPSGVATNGTYVGTAKLLATTTTNATGGWKIQGLSCSSPDQLYVTAEAGTPYPSGQNSTTLGNNPNSLMMTAIGDCSLLTSAEAGASDNVTSIVTNEASTVAAVWALRPFISLNGTTVNVTSSATNYAGSKGIGVPGNYAGLAHAFLNANLLAPYKVANFVQYTNGADGTANNGGLVPVQELNSLAYAQYLCTIGGPSGNAGDFTYCTQLYKLATPPGGTAPTNSLQAMLNIADYPANNAAAILQFSLTPIPLTTQTGLQVINAGVYVPALTSLGSTTKDWSVQISYDTGFGSTPTGQALVVPEYLAIDANDSVYVTNPNAATGTEGNIVAITSDGRSLWTSDTTADLHQPIDIAPDAFGNVWVTNSDAAAPGSFVEQINAATGATVKQYPSTSTNLRGIATDSLGNVWYSSTSTTGQNLHELVRSGSTYSEAAFSPLPVSTYPLYQIRTDSNNNIWIGGQSSTAAAAVYFPNTGTASAPTYTAGLLYAPLAGTPVSSSIGGITIAFDAKANAYSAYSVTDGSSGGIYKTTVTGSGTSAVLTPNRLTDNPAFLDDSGESIGYLDTDGAGSVWIPEIATTTYLYQYAPSVGTNGTSTAYYPCRNAGTTTGSGTSQSCSESFSTKYDFAIDSTGSIWVATYGTSFLGHVEQVIGLAAPTVPLRALGKAGVMP